MILKALQERNKTLSELSRELSVTKPSLFYHMLKLSERGLVRRIKRNKFVYYSLTEKGENYIKLLLSLTISMILSYGLLSLLRSDSYVSSSAPTRLPTVYTSANVYTTNVSVAFILSFVFLFTIIYFALLLLKR